MRSVSVNQFRIDNNVAYTIQQVTGDSTQEVLGYFHGIAMFVGEDIAKSKRSHFNPKDIVLFYKETSIPYRLRIKGGHLNDRTNKVELAVAVSFPVKSDVVQDVTDLMSKIIEVGLGLVEEDPMPKFVRPELKTPRCLKTVRLAQNERK